MWKIVNRKRKKRKTVNETIDMEDWDNYFRKLLGWKVWRIGAKEAGGRKEDTEEGIGREKIRRVISKLKDGKAAGGDGVPNEVWKYGGIGIKEVFGGIVQ